MPTPEGVLSKSVSGKLRSTLTSLTEFWQSPNTGATNESGFSALPNGYRFGTGSFDNFRSTAYWWSYVPPGVQGVPFVAILPDGRLMRSRQSSKMGFAIRCVKD